MSIHCTKSTRCLWLRSTAIAVFGVAAHLNAIPMNQSTLIAEDFFSGPQLAMAHAMDANDMPRLQQLARTNDPSAPGNRGMTLMWYAMQPAIRTSVRWRHWFVLVLILTVRLRRAWAASPALRWVRRTGDS